MQSENKPKTKKVGKLKRNAKSKFRDEINGVLIISFSIFIGVCIFNSSGVGAFGVFVKNLITSLIGIGSFFIPFVIFYLGLTKIVEAFKIDNEKRKVGIIILVATIVLIMEIAYLNEHIPTIAEMPVNESFNQIRTPQSPFNGGIIGYFLTLPLIKLIGSVGCFLLVSAFMIISIILIFNFSLYDTVKKVKETKKEDFVDEDSEHVQFAKKSKIMSLLRKLNKDEDDNNEPPMDSSSLEVPFLKEGKKSRGKLKVINIEDEYDDSTNNSQEVEKNINNTDSNFGKQADKQEESSLSDHIMTRKENDINYKFPNTALLNKNIYLIDESNDKREAIGDSKKLKETLDSFGVKIRDNMSFNRGPSVTRFEIQPVSGVKVSKIVNLSDDIALRLAAKGVRIEAPIPGKSFVGVEVSNKRFTPVFLREVIESKEFLNSNKNLTVALGKDVTNTCIVTDLTKMPHLLIAGATGSGKSVCINSIIISLLYKYSPKELRILLIDPKVVELNVYNDIPHLLVPVVTEPKKAAGALNWAVNEMVRRYKLFSENGTKNIDSYNNLAASGKIEEKLPLIVIIIDELADLMMVCPNDIEEYIARLTQMARAAGMHLIIATQRPSVDVITGVIKANIPSRIAFAVSSQVDSRTILDSSGAEKLLGKGDMLFYPLGEIKPLRLQGALITEQEVQKVVDFVKNNSKSKEEDLTLKDEIEEHMNSEQIKDDEGSDELFIEAVKVVIEYKQASTSLLQRRLKIGYNRAARIMEELEEKQIISQRDGTKPRQILVDASYFM